MLNRPIEVVVVKIGTKELPSSKLNLGIVPKCSFRYSCHHTHNDMAPGIYLDVYRKLITLLGSHSHLASFVSSEII